MIRQETYKAISGLYDYCDFDVTRTWVKMMIFFKFGEFKNIDDLDRYIRGLRVQDGIMNLRQKLRVLVIDDQDFAPLKILLNHNFNITTYKDIPSFDLLTDFQIVMVDLQGVGQHLNPILQGAQTS